VWQTPLTNPSFAKNAENCGVSGIRVEKRNKHNRPTLLKVLQM